MKSSWWTIPKTVWCWLWLGLGWRAGLAWQLPIGFDEVYYYTYSRHLHWSYFDHPPMVAFTTGLGWWLTDTITPLTVRLCALGLYGLSLGLFYQVAEYLFDRRTSTLTVAIASVSPLLWLAFGVLASPDNGLIFFWTMTLLIAAYEFVPNPVTKLASVSTLTYEPSYRVALLGVTLGLACLSKYHGFILGLGLVGFCLTRDRTRKVFRSPWIGLSLGLFLLTLTPLWIWNSQHEWISFRFHLLMRFAGGESSAYQISGLGVTWLLGVAYLFPAIGLPLWWTTGRSLLRQIRDWVQPPFTAEEVCARDRVALILWTSLPIALGFTLLGGKQSIYPAWPAPGFWGLTLLLAHAASRWRFYRVQRWLMGTGIAVAALAMIALLHLSLGVLQRPGNYPLLGRFFAPGDVVSTDLLDGVQLRSRVAENPSLRSLLQSADFIFTDEFYLSAYVDMAVSPLTDLPITCFSQDPRGFAFWYEPETWVGEDALYVTLASLHPDRDALEAEFQPYFQQLEYLTEIPLSRRGVVTETVLFYRATTLQALYSYPYP